MGYENRITDVSFSYHVNEMPNNENGKIIIDIDNQASTISRNCYRYVFFSRRKYYGFFSFKVIVKQVKTNIDDLIDYNNNSIRKS